MGSLYSKIHHDELNGETVHAFRLTEPTYDTIDYENSFTTLGNIAFETSQCVIYGWYDGESSSYPSRGTILDNIGNKIDASSIPPVVIQRVEKKPTISKKKWGNCLTKNNHFYRLTDTLGKHYDFYIDWFSVLK